MPTARARVATATRPSCCANHRCSLCPVDAKFTANNGLMDVFQHASVSVCPGAEVTRLEAAAGVARSVKFRSGGREFTVHGDLFVLGANAIHSPAILLRSGIDRGPVGKGCTKLTASRLKPCSTGSTTSTAARSPPGSTTAPTTARSAKAPVPCCSISRTAGSSVSGPSPGAGDRHCRSSSSQRNCRTTGTPSCSARTDEPRSSAANPALMPSPVSSGPSSSCRTSFPASRWSA
ncbi:GMC family oxidoreductase N-terminal domain-containing protein [Novosphingobium resinovorum]